MSSQPVCSFQSHSRHLLGRDCPRHWRTPPTLSQSTGCFPVRRRTLPFQRSLQAGSHLPHWRGQSSSQTRLTSSHGPFPQEEHPGAHTRLAQAAWEGQLTPFPCAVRAAVPPPSCTVGRNGLGRLTLADITDDATSALDAQQTSLNLSSLPRAVMDNGRVFDFVELAEEKSLWWWPLCLCEYRTHCQSRVCITSGRTSETTQSCYSYVPPTTSCLATLDNGEALGATSLFRGCLPLPLDERGPGKEGKRPESCFSELWHFLRGLGVSRSGLALAAGQGVGHKQFHKHTRNGHSVATLSPNKNKTSP